MIAIGMSATVSQKDPMHMITKMYPGSFIKKSVMFFGGIMPSL